MKTSLLSLLCLLSFCGFSQTTDTAAILREADSLMTVADELRKAGKPNDALPLAETAREIIKLQAGEFHQKYVGCLNLLGNCNITASKFKEAEGFYLQAKSIQESTIGENHEDYATTLSNLAALYAMTGKLDAAEPLCTKAVAIREKLLGKENADYAGSLNALAAIYLKKGNYKGAEPLLLEVKEVFEKTLGTEHPDYSKCLNNLASIYRRLDRFDEAEPLYHRVKDIREKVFGKAHPDYAAILNGLAVFYQSIGRLETALPYYLEAIAILKQISGTDNVDYYYTISNLAVLYKQLDRMEDAGPLYLEGLAIVEKISSKEHTDYATGLNNLANYYGAIGSYEQAHHCMEQAKSIWAKTSGTAHPDYAKALTNLGTLHFKQANYMEAEPYYIEAKNLREAAFGKEHLEYAESLLNLASLYGETGQFETADHLYQGALAIREKTLGKETPDYAACLNNLGVLRYQQQQFDLAEALLLEAKTIREKILGKTHPDYVKTLTSLSQLYWQTHRVDSTVGLLEEANNVQRNKLAHSSRYLSEKELRAYSLLFVKSMDETASVAQSNPAFANSISPDVFDNALFYKGFLMTAANNVRKLALSGPESANQYELLLSLHRRLAKEYAKPLAARKSVETLETQVNALEKELARTVRGFGEAVQQVNWQQVQAALQPGEAAVEFVRYQVYTPQPTDSVMYAALVLRPGDAAPHFLPLFEERQLSQILKSAAGNRFRKINDFYAFDGKGEALHSLIWKPLEPLLKGTVTVWCSPTGILHRLNLGALPTGKNRSFDQSHPVVLLGSTRQVVFHAAETGRVAGHRSAFVLGGVQYEMDSTALASAIESGGERGADFSPKFETDSLDRGSEWKFLPETQKEAVAVDRLLRDAGFKTKLHSGYTANEENFWAMSGYFPNGKTPQVMHLATHAFFFPEPNLPPAPSKGGGGASAFFGGGRGGAFKFNRHPMMRAGLILAGANHAWKTGKPLEGREDGILTAYEISQMNLSDTELVVLSACETGLGDIEGNEGVYGLQRAFKIAGAKYLIMSLWKVSDETARELMTDFYEQWMGKGWSIPEAFRAAQGNMKRRYPNAPFHWAGFVLYE